MVPSVVSTVKLGNVSPKFSGIVMISDERQTQTAHTHTKTTLHRLYCNQESFTRAAIYTRAPLQHVRHDIIV